MNRKINNEGGLTTKLFIHIPTIFTLLCNIPIKMHVKPYLWGVCVCAGGGGMTGQNPGIDQASGHL